MREKEIEKEKVKEPLFPFLILVDIIIIFINKLSDFPPSFPLSSSFFSIFPSIALSFQFFSLSFQFLSLSFSSVSLSFPLVS